MSTISPEAAIDLSFLDGISHPLEDRQYLQQYGDSDWEINSSNLDDYSRRAAFFDRPNGLVQVIHDHLVKQENNVGLDLGSGPRPRALGELLELGVIGRALAANYAPVQPDEALGDKRLDFMRGDLIRTDTWHALRQWQLDNAPQGFNIVMHRPMGGLQNLPAHVYRGAAHTLLDMMAPRGLLFTQVPRRLVDQPQHLRVVCQSMGSRPDVDSIVASPPRTFAAHYRHENVPDESDAYVAIVKSRAD